MKKTYISAVLLIFILAFTACSGPAPSSANQQNEADSLYKRGNSNMNSGDINRAIKDYTAALKINPDFYQALNNRGNAYLNKGSYDRAIADYTATFRIKPDLYHALSNRGVAYYNKGEHDRAIKDWEAVLRFNPDDDSAKRNIQMVREQQGADTISTEKI